MIKRIRKCTPFIIGDIRSIISGIINFARYSLSDENVPVSLSLFSSASYKTETGRACRYDVSIANNTPQGLWINFLIDIYQKNNPAHPEGHYAYYEKRVYLQTQASQKIKIIYDWEKPPLFDIDGTVFSPDNSWRGSLKEKGKYLLHAILKAEDGNFIEQLTLIQEVSG
ncbi:MAG: hypothetical protein HZC48_06350 [Nitrospirae bacterium]|nr:hypothetical protein [Nitrospirota bacterium]